MNRLPEILREREWGETIVDVLAEGGGGETTAKSVGSFNTLLNGRKLP
jgi:hypothetical protein